VSIARRERRKKLLFDPKQFPALTADNHAVTSDPVEEQDCIAYAAGDPHHYWWPVQGFPNQLPPPYFWPIECDLKETVDAFICAFGTVGFKRCSDDEDGRVEDNKEKIAIYAKKVGSSMEPTHAAKQMRNGKWRSKMGEDEDIEHNLAALEGPEYGRVLFFMWRSLDDKKLHDESLTKTRRKSH
jgi:hypothetical protein